MSTLNFRFVKLSELPLDDAKSSAFSPWPSKSDARASQMVTEDDDDETDDNEDVEIDDEKQSEGRQTPASRKSPRPDDTVNSRAKPSIFSVSSLLSNDRGRSHDKPEDKEDDEMPLPPQLQGHHLGKPPLFYTGKKHTLK